MHAARVTVPATDSWFDQLDTLPASRQLGALREGAGRAHGLVPAPAPVDQAQGLRRLFTSPTIRCVPVVSNPELAHGGALLERLCTAFAGQGLRTLVVDAGEHARAPAELAGFDLAEGIETLSPQVGYLAARGLALRYVDASGSTSSFLDALIDAAPGTDVLLVHASASDLVRLFARRAQELQADALRPLVLCDLQPEAVTHAYAAIKLLATRARLMAHDLLIAAEPASPRAGAVAQRLARCADDFLGAVVHDWVAVDPAETADHEPSSRLARLAREQLACALAQPLSDSAFAALDAGYGADFGTELPRPRRAALPSTGPRSFAAARR
ncbi:MAG TPA: flagellar biosynthesis protein [Methylibium sp.]|uniref:flagellar biosynthesis protein n=1 Tax=Methylibium sp. TaxID=2067992 RepID=UPI002DB593C9|nr:flagellar biosynthesis protein [Methylibium sp.]HEU4458214.1 flagellar biosynthesis protein [Methylibium sp.]